jgi:hypothetical protein
MSSTTLRSSAELFLLVCVLAALPLLGCPSGDVGAPTEPALHRAAPGDPGAPNSEPAAGGPNLAVEDPGGDVGPTDEPQAKLAAGSGSGDSAAAPAPVPSAGDARLVSLLSGYEGPEPTAEQLRAAVPDPEAALLRLSRDTGRSGVVRQGATRALGVLGGAAARERLMELMGSSGTDARLRRAAVQAASQQLAEDPDLRPAVESRLRDAVPGVARAAVLGLARSPESRAVLEALDTQEVPPQVKTALDQVLRGGVEPTDPSEVQVEHVGSGGPPERR